MKETSKLVIIVLFVVVPSFCFGQNKTWIISPGLSYQKQYLGELNIMYGEIVAEHGICLTSGPRIGVETNFNSEHFLLAPKIGYEFPLALPILRTSFVAYTNGKGQWDFRLLPEIVLNYYIVNLSYGYNIPLSKKRISNIGGHRISLSLIIDIDWF
ncbi:MAG: hypothetical protein LBV31_01850 [Prevotellaceae bacterium]|jgi:hypothetical protein|nr:hypothetical protein [Prevotellaceae bacterium]